MTMGFYSSFCHQKFFEQYALYTKNTKVKSTEYLKLTLSLKPRLNGYHKDTPD